MPITLPPILRGIQPAFDGRKADRGPAYRSDRYARQRRAGFRWLRFIPEIEREFRNSALIGNVLRVRVAATIGLCVIPGFMLLDQWGADNLTPVLGDLVLLMITLPAMLIPLLTTFRSSLIPQLRTYMFAGTLVTAFSILAVVTIGRAGHPSFPYESLILVTLFIYFVSGLLFFEAIFVSLALWSSFLLCGFAFDWPRLAYEGYYLLVANAVSVVGLYLIERQLRQGFLLERELRAHAVLDGLTGALNRRAFRMHLNAAWRQAQRESQVVGLLLLDLDHFKLINDRHGHPFGDAVLRRVARVLRDHAARGMDAVGRYGGDEFIAMWYAPDPHWFESLTQRLPEILRATVLGESDDHRITVSGGAVLARPSTDMTVKEAVRLADEKLYEVKRSGRDGIVIAELVGAGAGTKPPRASAA